MRINFFTLIAFAAIGFAPAAFAYESEFSPSAFAAQVNHMEYVKTMPVAMSSGGALDVHIVKMGDHRMAVVPLSALESILSRSEGRSVSFGQ
jgi:hypothetical protein